MPARALWRTGLVALGALSLAACGAGPAPSARQSQRFLDSVYSRAPDIGGYRTGSQLVSLGEAVCADLRAGATVQQLADRTRLLEGSVALPPADLGVVISAAVAVMCPTFSKLLG